MRAGYRRSVRRAMSGRRSRRVGRGRSARRASRSGRRMPVRRLAGRRTMKRRSQRRKRGTPADDLIEAKHSDPTALAAQAGMTSGSTESTQPASTQWDKLIGWNESKFPYN